jgi:hypothetical protein
MSAIHDLVRNTHVAQSTIENALPTLKVRGGPISEEDLRVLLRAWSVYLCDCLDLLALPPRRREYPLYHGATGATFLGALQWSTDLRDDDVNKCEDVVKDNVSLLMAVQEFCEVQLLLRYGLPVARYSEPYKTACFWPKAFWKR